jgi:acetyl esterase/lipase
MGYDFDPELAPWAAGMAAVDYTDIGAARGVLRGIAGGQPAYLPRRPVDIVDRAIPGPRGAAPVAVRTYRPAGSPRALPALIYLHWGGFVFGDLDTVDATATRLADQLGAMVVSVDYRLAPEYPFPSGLHDCFATLVWVAEHADELGIDPDRIGVGGESAGGGLAAALALLARDRQGPRLCFQCLVYPQLDDRLDTVSARSFVDTPKWNRASALHSWSYYLGVGQAATVSSYPVSDYPVSDYPVSDYPVSDYPVSCYAAPARALDLSGLPAAFVSVCEFDPLRDEGVDYARRLSAAGVDVELRNYPGTFHASVSIADAAVSKRMLADQVDALRRGLGVPRSSEGVTEGALR